MQAFEDLKQDIQNLIDTAGDTIKQLVDDAARREREWRASGGAVGGVSPGAPAGSDGGEFTSQIEELRTKVRAAVENLKHQAQAAMANPSFPVSGDGGASGGSSGGTPPAPSTSADTSQIGGGGASGGGVGVGGNPAGTPQSETPGLNQGAIDSNNVDDQMPAGGKDTGLPPPPNFGAGVGSTIGPDSFKSGA